MVRLGLRNLNGLASTGMMVAPVCFAQAIKLSSFEANIVDRHCLDNPLALEHLTLSNTLDIFQRHGLQTLPLKALQPKHLPQWLGCGPHP